MTVKTHRTRYSVTGLGKDTARFSNHDHAGQFAQLMSEVHPDRLIEVVSPDGLLSQYRAGRPAYTHILPQETRP